MADLVVVRRVVPSLLTGQSEDVVADAMLVADALASNAYDHGGDPQGRPAHAHPAGELGFDLLSAGFMVVS